MSEKPEALRLAHWLERDGANCQAHIDAAAELRRLHAVNQELLEALKEAALAIEDWGSYASDYFRERWDLQGDINAARAAIAKAEAA
jgi:hypothetical protein